MTRRLVLDTNAVLDLLHFADPRCAVLGELWRAERIRCVRDAATLAELARILRNPRLGIAETRAQRLLDEYTARTASLEAGEDCAPPATARRALPLCRDPDDQKFLELARRSAAAMLVSKDKALLELDRKCARFGLRILDPQGAGEWLRGEIAAFGEAPAPPAAGP